MVIEGHMPWHGTVPQPVLQNRACLESPGGCPVSPPYFPVSPRYGQFWDGAASSRMRMASSCFDREATRCRANALYHPKASSAQHRSALGSMEACQSQYDGCVCGSKTGELFAWHPLFFPLSLSVFDIQKMSASL